MKAFVVLQPGCDMTAADVWVFDEDDQTESIDYIVARGGNREFFEHAEIGDAMPFGGERVVLRVGKVWR